jgi:hypothetical protein
VRNLESRLTPERDWPWIPFVYDEEDGEEGEAAAQAEAVANWESENGPLGDRKLNFIVNRIITPTSPEDV